MKRFHFRLASVLKWKRQRQRQAELRQQQAQLALAAAHTAVERLRERLTQTAAALAAQVGRTIPVGSWLANYEHGSQVRQTLEAAEAEAQHAAHNLREADAQRAKIATEVEALLYLRRRQWEEYRQEAARSEQAQRDEAGLRRWQAARAGGRFGRPAEKEEPGL